MENFVLYLKSVSYFFCFFHFSAVRVEDIFTLGVAYIKWLDSFPAEKYPIKKNPCVSWKKFEGNMKIPTEHTVMPD